MSGVSFDKERQDPTHKHDIPTAKPQPHKGVSALEKFSQDLPIFDNSENRTISPLPEKLAILAQKIALLSDRIRPPTAQSIPLISPKTSPETLLKKIKEKPDQAIRVKVVLQEGEFIGHVSLFKDHRFERQGVKDDQLFGHLECNQIACHPKYNGPKVGQIIYQFDKNMDQSDIDKVLQILNSEDGFIQVALTLDEWQDLMEHLEDYQNQKTENKTEEEDKDKKGSTRTEINERFTSSPLQSKTPNTSSQSKKQDQPREVENNNFITRQEKNNELTRKKEREEKEIYRLREKERASIAIQQKKAEIATDSKNQRDRKIEQRKEGG